MIRQYGSTNEELHAPRTWPVIMDCPNSDFEDHIGGPPAVFVDDHKDGDVEYKVVCGCGFEGVIAGSIEGAVEAWNKQ